MRILIPALVAGALVGCVTAPQPTQSPLQLAITIDDLPLHGPIPTGSSPQQVAETLITALRAGGAGNAIGFVNGHWTAEQPATSAVLTSWRQSGLRLGNHGWAHRNFDELTTPEFEEELTRNEPLLDSVAGGSDWHWFRYPFLAEGATPEKLAMGRAVLARHGYKVAAVTMDFSDWQFTAPYARCVDKHDEPAIARMETLYLAAAGDAVTWSRRLSQQVHGRDIPYVILLHGGAFTARMMPRLLAFYRSAGFRFVSIDQAEADPAYTMDVQAAAGPAATLNGQAEAKGIAEPPGLNTATSLAALCN